MPTGVYARPSLEERFWSKVERSEGCWVWTRATFPTGYGKFRSWGGRTEYAHRVAWVLAHGAIPKNGYVLHRCDNPPCVRPDHLFLGTAEDNMHDMIVKGRHRNRYTGRLHDPLLS